MGIWYDLEDADGYKSNRGIAFDGSNGTLFTDFCVTFCEDIKDAGYSNVGIYASRSPFESILDANRIASYPKWMAVYYYYDLRDNDVNGEDYNNSPYLMWQYSSFGQVNGSNSRTDLNFLYGNLNVSQSSTPDMSEIDAMIESAYQDILHRSVDIGGLQGWRDALISGMDISTMRDTLNNCPEKLAMIEAELETKKQYVRDLYVSELGRGSSESEVSLYLQWNADEIFAAIYNSAEAENHRNSVAQTIVDEQNRVVEEARIAEENRLAQIEAERVAEEQRLAQIESDRLAEIERSRVIREAKITYIKSIFIQELGRQIRDDEINSWVELSDDEIFNNIHNSAQAIEFRTPIVEEPINTDISKPFNNPDINAMGIENRWEHISEIQKR